MLTLQRVQKLRVCPVVVVAKQINAPPMLQKLPWLKVDEEKFCENVFSCFRYFKPYKYRKLFA